MKKIYIVLILAIGMVSCRKDKSAFLSGAGTSSGSSDSYQPVSKGSYWKYKATFGTSVSTSTQTMTGNTTTLDGKSYFDVTYSSDSGTPPGTGYWYVGNNTFAQRSNTLVQGVEVEFEYLHDNLDVNATWVGKLNSTNTVNGAPAKLTGTIKEKGITKIVNGKTYNNVIHTELVLQYDYGVGTGFEDAGIYDTYIAKGIGIIEVDSKVGGFGFFIDSKSELIEYSIK